MTSCLVQARPAHALSVKGVVVAHNGCAGIRASTYSLGMLQARPARALAAEVGVIAHDGARVPSQAPAEGVPHAAGTLEAGAAVVQHRVAQHQQPRRLQRGHAPARMRPHCCSFSFLCSICLTSSGVFFPLLNMSNVLWSRMPAMHQNEVDALGLKRTCKLARGAMAECNICSL